MPAIQNGRVLFNSVPEGYPIPGETTVYDTTQTIDPETVPLNGGFLIKTLVLSVDPYFRVLMQHAEKEPNSVRPASRLAGFGIAVVLRSDTPRCRCGKVYLRLHHTSIMEKHPDLPWTAYVGAAGMPGQTAYMGWKEFADAKQGEVAFVTTGAGTGTIPMVIQLAKHAGLKVIASAGSDEKVAFMRSLGADVAFNYKTTDTRAVLAKEGPIDIYWDNVGGDILDAALEFAAVHARFLECGAISGYNTGPQAVKNFHLIGRKALHVHGIAMTHFPVAKYAAEFYATVPAALASGEIKYAEEVTQGLERVGEVILAVQRGTNRAKAVVVGRRSSVAHREGGDYGRLSIHPPG
ncbi:hypothetical protein B0H10DRAFT_2164475 [Mycena sp. CBHHK59/15]|nr:hypothetical protein B0H10DRAFT_2164475 [Mycena sp. CBHHK59/15]